MKVKQILSIKEIAEDKKLPCDMYELYDTKYMSVSRDEMIPISEMDIIHLIRAFKNDRHKLANQFTDKDLVKQNDVLVNTNKVLGRQHDIWKEKAMNMIEQSTHTELEMENQRLVQQLEADEHNVGKLDDTVPKATYQVMWDNCQSLQNQAVKNRNENKTLKKQVEHWKKLAEDNFISSVNDSETSDTFKNKYEELREKYHVLFDAHNVETNRDTIWQERYNKEVEKSDFWHRAYVQRCTSSTGHNYVFSEIPNDCDGQRFTDDLKQYLNKDSYKMRVRGQYLKDEVKENEGWRKYERGQPIDKSKCLRVYLDKK